MGLFSAYRPYSPPGGKILRTALQVRQNKVWNNNRMHHKFLLSKYHNITNVEQYNMHAGPCQAVSAWLGVNSKIWAPFHSAPPPQGNVSVKFSGKESWGDFPENSLIFNTFRNSSIPGPPLRKSHSLGVLHPLHPPVVPALHAWQVGR